MCRLGGPWSGNFLRMPTSAGQVEQPARSPPDDASQARLKAEDGGLDMAAAQQSRSTRTTSARTTQRRGAQATTRGGATGRGTTRRGATRTNTEAEESAAETTSRKASVPVPIVTPHVSVHRVQIPAPPMRLPVSGREMADAGKAVTSYLPPPDRLAYYAGLGALAAFGVVEWPVALAIGVGVGVARRAGRARDQWSRATGSQSRQE